MSTTSNKKKSSKAHTNVHSVKYNVDKTRVLKALVRIPEHDILEGTVSIASYAFSNCKRLTSITIPDSMRIIGKYAFACCERIRDIAIPANVESIGEGALAYCYNLNTIVVADENKYYDSRNNCKAIIETKSNTLIAGCMFTTIPNDVNKIDCIVSKNNTY